MTVIISDETIILRLKDKGEHVAWASYIMICYRDNSFRVH